MNKFFKNKSAGISAIEFVVVLSIMLAIGFVGFSKFQSFLVKARFAQAKTYLTHIYKLQTAHYATENEYSTMPLVGRKGRKIVCTPNNLGFEIKNCPNPKIAYGYIIKKANNNSYLAKAASGSGKFNLVSSNCKTRDVWTINDVKALKHKIDSTKKCK